MERCTKRLRQDVYIVQEHPRMTIDG
jgi:hypothetical protein